jgi:hypothetical protein
MAGISGDDETTLHKAFRIIASMQGLKELDVELRGILGGNLGGRLRCCCR